MTIRRGQPWGEPGALAAEAPVFDSDRAASRWLTSVLGPDGSGSPGRSPAELGLTGGDLHRTLGGPRRDEPQLRRGGGVRHPVDAAEVRWSGPDGDEHVDLALAHVVVRRGAWWRRRTVAVMNAAFVGGWNLGPRAHPNDGRLDVTDGRLPWRDRRTARRRAAAGTHVPHPALVEARVRELELELDPATDLWLDGERVGRARRVAVRCRPDALVVVA